MTLPAGASATRCIGGGDINEAWHVQLGGRDGFVKTRAGAGAGEYALEAEGLPGRPVSGIPNSVSGSASRRESGRTAQRYG